VGHDDFGLCVDFWNIWQTPDVERVIESAGERIFVVQTSDYAPPRSMPIVATSARARFR